MDFEKLLWTSSKSVANEAIAWVGEDPQRFNEILQLCLSSPYPLAMRAGMVLSSCAENHPKLFEPYANTVLHQLPMTKIDGVKRALLRIYALNTDLQKLEHLGLLLDFCIKVLLNSQEAIAVKHYATVITIKLAKAEPDILNELIPILEDDHFATTPAFKKRVTQQLTQLRINRK